MSLKESLDEIKSNAKEQIAEEDLKLMGKATKELENSGLSEKALQQGDTLPPFSLKNMDGELISSADLLKTGLLVVSFYRGNW